MSLKGELEPEKSPSEALLTSGASLLEWSHEEAC